MGFIYQNIPAFDLNSGDTLAFDTGAPNDVPLQFNIALSATTANGGTVQSGYTQVVTTGTPAAPMGDNIIGNYDLAFTINTGFSFAGGGLIIRFEPTGGSTGDFSGDQVLMVSDATDSSSFFVQRFYFDADGVSPYNGQGGEHIGNFRITTGAQVPEPPTLLLLGVGLLGYGWRQRKKVA